MADPDQDWQSLLGDESPLDVAAVHPLVGPERPAAVRVIVPGQYAIWVPPGACDNNIGYWHVPGRARRLRARRRHPLVRDHVADLLARRLVPGPPRRLQPDRHGPASSTTPSQAGPRLAGGQPGANQPRKPAAGRYPAVALAPCTDPVSCPLRRPHLADHGPRAGLPGHRVGVDVGRGKADRELRVQVPAEPR